MAIYRGPGGAGDATGDATNASALALAAKNEAQASATAAASSATAAASSATSAASSATNAATSATNAAGSATTASTAATNASTYATNAASSATTAASEASNAADSASAAASSATSASTDASTASTQATNAASSASSASTSASTATTKASEAATSATNAASSATTASTAATNASNSAAAAATSETNAASSASSASTSASTATTQASNASSSASSASTSASTATTKASEASTSATNAASSASSASTSATNASNSASAASTSATNAASSATAAATSASNAASTLANALVKTNNLSDVSSASTARANLGLAIGTNVQAYSSELQAISNGGGNAMFKNRIINGAMTISQRGTSFTPTADSYTLDRFCSGMTQASKMTFAQSSTAPAGFSNSMSVTVASVPTVGSSDWFGFFQKVEGFNSSDLGFGAAGASTVTISFWVRSSVTGVYGGSLMNSSQNRSYPYTYTVNAANTWEQKTVTIAGDTSGTWVGATNGTGLLLIWSLGAGSSFLGTANAWGTTNALGTTGQQNWVTNSGATFYITGVQLEKGSTATSFDYRPYGTELALCQRYYEKSYAQGVSVPTNSSNNGYSGFPSGGTIPNANVIGQIIFKVTKRTDPTVTTYSYASSTASTMSVYAGTDLASGSATVSIPNQSNFNVFNSSGGTITPSAGGFVCHWAASAEL